MNEHTPNSDNAQEYISIPLKGGLIAKISLQDADLAKIKWQIRHRPKFGGPYARANQKIGGKTRPVYLHQIVALRKTGLKPTRELQVDHKNTDTLDNRRSNIRLATPNQNQANRKRQNNNTSGYKGVSYVKRIKKYRAQIGFKGRIYHLGYYDTPEYAHEIYCQAARTIYGEFAHD